MLKADKACFNDLISDDEQRRISAADRLASLPNGHFEDHPLSNRFVREKLPDFLTAYDQSHSRLVREWIVQAIADSQIVTDRVKAIVAESLIPSCSCLPTLLYLIGASCREFQHLKPQIKTLHTHPDHEVRWRVAWVLERMQLDYHDDILAIRSLMSDNYDTTRTYAVLSLNQFTSLLPEDLDQLRLVTQLDHHAAKHYAEEILSRYAR